MICLKSRFLTNKFARSVAVIAGGTVFAQLLNILLSPIITRLYSPEEYGVLTIYTAILGIISLAAFKYEMAIPISKDDKTAINVLVLCLIVLSIFVLLLTIVLIFFGSTLLNILNMEILFNYRFLLPLGVLLSGLYIIFKSWSYRIKDFKSISTTTMTQSVTSNLIKVITGILGMGSFGLIIGTIIGQSFGIRVLSRPVFKKNKKLLTYVKASKILYLFKRYKAFPIYNAPNKFLISLGHQLPIIFLGTFYGSGVVGSYGLAYTIVKLPMNLIGNSVGDVFFSEAASIGRDNPRRLKTLSNKLIKKLIIIGLIPLSILLLFGPSLFSLIFGSNWYQAGVISQFISIMLFFTLVFTPISRVFEVFEKQKTKFLIDTIRVLLIIIVFWISWSFSFGSYVAILLYSIVMSLIYFVTYLNANKILNSEICKIDRHNQK